MRIMQRCAPLRTTRKDSSLECVTPTYFDIQRRSIAPAITTASSSAPKTPIPGEADCSQYCHNQHSPKSAAAFEPSTPATLSAWDCLSGLTCDPVSVFLRAGGAAAQRKDDVAVLRVATGRGHNRRSSRAHRSLPNNGWARAHRTPWGRSEKAVSCRAKGTRRRVRPARLPRG